jgi:Kdo2-lipid IVA lauroyltransferase/acyltransferase
MNFMRALLGLFFKFLSYIIVLLPRRAQLAIGDLIGLLWFDVFRIRRKVALENLNRAFPDWPVEKKISTARTSLRSMGRTFVEFSLFPFINEKNWNQYFDCQGFENIDRALEGGKGVILLSMHVGNGDFATIALSRSGYKINLISKVFKTKWLNDMWFGMRAKHGTRFIAPEKSTFDILKSLKRNEAVIFVLDQFMGPPVGVRTLFFGHETGTAAGLATMAERTGVSVLPAYSYRKPDGRHVVVIEPPVRQDQSLTEKNIARMTQAYTDKIEQIVRQHPEQWMWIHRRWKEFRE